MKEKTAGRSSLTLLEVGVVLVIAVSLGAYVVQRATVARQKAVAGTLKAAGAKIKYGDDGSVRSIDLTAMPEDRIELDDIALLTELTAINLDHSETLDEHLAKLSGLEQLTTLHLVGTAITDAGCRHLARHSAMRFLDLRADFVTDDGLSHVGKLTELVELRLAQTWITDAGLMSLAGMKNLKTLDLRHTDVTDAGLKHLHPLKNLTMVRLVHSRVTELGVAELKKAIPNLAVEFNPDRSNPGHLRVHLRPPKYTGERDRISRLHISERAICREILDLDQETIADASDDISDAEAARNRFIQDYWDQDGFLVHLSIAPKAALPHFVSKLTVCRNLEYLGFGTFPLADNAFALIHRIRFLRILSIRSPLSDRQIADISRLPNLAALNLRNTSGVPSSMTDESLKSIAEISTLTNLELVNSPVSDEGLRQLTMQKLPNLRVIFLSGVSNVTREGVYYLLNEFPQYQEDSCAIQGDSQIKYWTNQYEAAKDGPAEPVTTRP